MASIQISRVTSVYRQLYLVRKEFINALYARTYAWFSELCGLTRAKSHIPLSANRAFVLRRLSHLVAGSKFGPVFTLC